MTAPGEAALVSVDDDELRVSLQGPAGWVRTKSDVFPLQLFAPEDDGFRASFNLSHERFDPPSEQGLAEFVIQTRRAQQADYEGFLDLGTEELTIDNRPASLQRYSWTPAEMNRSLEQLLGLVVLGPGLLLELDATALSERADTYVPVFRTMFESLRIAQ